MNINVLYCKILLAQFGDFLPGCPVELLEMIEGLLLCFTRKIPLPQWPLPRPYIIVKPYLDFLGEVSSRLIVLTNEASPWPEYGTWLAKSWPPPSYQLVPGNILELGHMGDKVGIQMVMRPQLGFFNGGCMLYKHSRLKLVPFGPFVSSGFL